MKVLASQIALEVTTHGHCGVYEEELGRIWPLSDRDRQQKLEEFAQKYGFRLRFYQKGLCAIFDKAPADAVIISHKRPAHSRG
jgi:hypothetical protein